MPRATSAVRARTSKRAPVSAVRRKRAPAARPALAVGLAVVTIELRTDQSLRVRTRSGSALPARLDPSFEPELALECLRDHRPVLAEIGADGEAVLLGALQQRRGASRDAHDTLELTGKRLELGASDEVRIKVGKSVLRLDKHGVVRMTGQKLTMDVAAVVRVLSALVELP